MNSQCHVRLQAPLGWKVFQPPYRVLSRVNMKKHCAHVRVRLVLCLLLLVWLEMHKLQFNLSRIFKNIYEVTVFVINWAWLRGEAPVTFLRNIGARLVTASLARWLDGRIFSNDSSMYQIHPIWKMAIFQFPHSLVAKDIQDSLVSKRWKYSIYDKITCKSNFLGLQSKLAESGGLSVLEND